MPQRGRLYGLLLVANAAWCALWAWYRIAVDVQFLPYPHFLVDYSFGFVRRGLVGAITALVLPRVPITAVFVFGIVSVLTALGLYLLLFRRDFGFSRRTLPLLVLVAGSPFFFKNFFYNLGYFDVLGCIVALAALLLPVGTAYPLVLAAGSVALILTHHIHLLLYVPTIAFIALVRYGAAGGRLNTARLAWCGALLLGVGGAFLFVMAHATPPVSEAAFLAHMKARALDPFHEAYASVWYRTPAQEWHDSLAKLPANLAQAPLYLLMAAAHWPLLRFFRQTLAGLSASDRRLAFTGLGAIAAGYVVIFAMVFDYSRWVSSGLICLWLALHAIRALPSARPAPLPPMTGATLAAALLVTLIGRVGTVTPF
jgi:hypothetical protein